VFLDKVLDHLEEDFQIDFGAFIVPSVFHRIGQGS
jgi:hypothetical protein